MKRVLIVAPHFAPVSAPDGQRARMLAPHLPEFGWTPDILTVDSAAADAPLESELLATLPPDLPVTRVSAWPTRTTRPFGLGNIAWRAWPALRRTGERLLRPGRFDLVYFSTTQFACLPLGRIWQQRTGVPFAIDLQDPWRSDYQHGAGVRPPGGWKYRLAAAQARWLEPWTLRRCAGVIAVSSTYLDRLTDRYPWWPAAHGCTLPMGWSERDFAFAARANLSPAVDRSVIRYLGRLGDDLQPALEVFLAGVGQARSAGTAPHLRADFRGGSYDPRTGEGPVRRTALAHRAADAVTETPTRIPYLAALAALQTAGANLILGSDDSGYAPSKIWLVLAAGRPWLALARRDTVLHRLLAPHAGPGGWLIDPADDGAAAKVAAFCANLNTLPDGSADRPALELREARPLAREHATFFDRLTGSS